MRGSLRLADVNIVIFMIISLNFNRWIFNIAIRPSFQSSLERICDVGGEQRPEFCLETKKIDFLNSSCARACPPRKKAEMTSLCFVSAR